MMIQDSGGPVHINILPSRQIAKYLLDIGAVQFNVDNPYVWTSGIRSPIYCDNRVINSKVDVRKAVVTEFTKIITQNFLDRTDIIAGVATGGMPYGVLIADRLELPFIYVRSERKEYGLKKVVEGTFAQGDTVVLIEDHISTGKSSMKAVEFLREEGLQLICLLSIMTYGFKEADEKFKGNQVEHYSICDLDTVLEVAADLHKLSSQQVETILAFRESPKTWRP
jgi:orotate phosphoribosyltransferase